MSDLQDLYQDMVIDHNNRPRNYGALEGADSVADGFNPLCGDRLTLYLKIDNSPEANIVDVGFVGSGCAISRASASMMTESVRGKSAEEASRLFNAFRNMVTREPGSDFDADEVGDLEMLAGVAEYPARVKCATLAWHTLHNALQGSGGTASTE